MVDTEFTLVSGTYTDEQHLLEELDFFLTQTIGGWTQVKVVTDTVSDKDIAYYTDGSWSGYYDRFWLRLRATSNELRFEGASLFKEGSEDYNDSLGGSGATRDLPVGTSSGIYWFMANEDAAHIVVDHLDGNTRHGGFGLFITYYNRLEDPKPFYHFAQSAQEETFGTARVRAYGPGSWGKAYSTLSSGTAYNYEASHPALVAKGTPNPRSGEPKLIEPVFFTDSSFGASEVRGEIPGLYMCGGTGYTHGSFTTISGIPGAVSGEFFIHRHTDGTAWALGPVTVSGEGG